MGYGINLSVVAHRGYVKQHTRKGDFPCHYSKMALESGGLISAHETLMGF